MHENSKLKHVECVKKYSNNWKKDNLLYFNNNFEYLFFPFLYHKKLPTYWIFILFFKPLYRLMTVFILLSSL